MPRQPYSQTTNDPPSEWSLVAGLGNPGADYAAHRHNIGFRCVDAIAESHGIALGKKRFKGLYGEGRVQDSRVVLLKPQTFMNDSGASVAPASRWYKVDPGQIIVIYDDLDLPFGRIRVRPGGGSGGHNGIRSVIRELGSERFARIRVGIGRPTQGDPVDYVLNAFDREQAPYIPDICARVNQIVITLLSEGVKEAMNMFNGLDSVRPGPENE